MHRLLARKHRQYHKINKQTSKAGALNAGRETQLAQKESSALWSQLVADQHGCCVHWLASYLCTRMATGPSSGRPEIGKWVWRTLLKDQVLIPWLSMWLRLSYHACKTSIATNTVCPVLQLQACLPEQFSVLTSDCWIPGMSGPGTGVRHYLNGAELCSFWRQVHWTL